MQKSNPQTAWYRERNLWYWAAEWGGNPLALVCEMPPTGDSALRGFQFIAIATGEAWYGPFGDLQAAMTAAERRVVALGLVV